MIWLIMANALFVFTEASLAYYDRFLSANQVLASGYTRPFTPFLNHGGMWGDLFLLSPILALILKSYGPSWRPSVVAVVLLLSAVASALMHRMYAQISAKVPNFLAHHGSLTAAGWVHLVYMALVLTVLVLFYFCTRQASYAHAAWISTLLAIHIVLSVIQPAVYVGDSLLYPPILYPVLGSWALIASGFWFLTHFRT